MLSKRECRKDAERIGNLKAIEVYEKIFCFLPNPCMPLKIISSPLAKNEGLIVGGMYPAQGRMGQNWGCISENEFIYGGSGTIAE